MTSLTEPVQLSEYLFVDEQTFLSVLNFDNNTVDFTSVDEKIEESYLAFRKNFPYLPSHITSESSPLWKKLDEFLALNPAELWSNNFSLDYELMYYRSSQEINKPVDLLMDFLNTLLNELRTHNPKFVEVILFLTQHASHIHNAHSSVQTLTMPLFIMIYYVYHHWEKYMSKCLFCINYTILRKRSSLELDHIARSPDGQLFSSYADFKTIIDSYAETRKQVPLLTSADIAKSVLPDMFVTIVSELFVNNETMLTILQRIIHEKKKNERYPYHDKQYSFGYFDENGRFHYTGRMNALAYILDELELKGWSSCGDKVQLLLQHISFKGKGTTLKRNLESVVSNRADFTKASYHDEAVELLNAILKNCE